MTNDVRYCPVCGFDLLEDTRHPHTVWVPGKVAMCQNCQTMLRMNMSGYLEVAQDP
jgi:hypothetical protein